MEQENYIAFENYLSKSLSDEEVLAFEKKLASDSEFKTAFETYKELTGFLEHSLNENSTSKDFEANLTSISNNYFEKEGKQNQPRKKSKTFRIGQLAIAASVAIFLGVFTFNAFSKPSYDDYSNYDSISLSIRGDADDLVVKAQNAFNNRNFPEAEKYFSEILKINSNNTEAKLYKAISQIEQDKFIKADSTLSLIAWGKTAYKNDAIWYAALSKLKQKDNQACVKLLNSLSEDSIHYKKAQKLIDKLD